MKIVKTKEWIFGVIFILFTFVKLGNGMKCTKISECGCQLDDRSKSVDLSPITKIKSIPMFVKKSPDAVYMVDLCRNFDCGGSSSRVCESVTAEGMQTNSSIGQAITFEYNEQSDILTFVYSQSSSSARVILHCSDKDGIGTLTDFESSGPNIFKTTLTSSHACWTFPSVRHEHKLSNGSIICIVLLVVIVVYIVGGILINKYVRKVEEHDGDLFPNKKTWKKLTILIKDGCRFTCGKLTRSSEYEHI